MADRAGTKLPVSHQVPTLVVLLESQVNERLERPLGLENKKKEAQAFLRKLAH